MYLPYFSLWGTSIAIWQCECWELNSWLCIWMQQLETTLPFTSNVWCPRIMPFVSCVFLGYFSVFRKNIEGYLCKIPDISMWIWKSHCTRSTLFVTCSFTFFEKVCIWCPILGGVFLDLLGSVIMFWFWSSVLHLWSERDGMMPDFVMLIRKLCKKGQPKNIKKHRSCGSNDNPST